MLLSEVRIATGDSNKAWYLVTFVLGRRGSLGRLGRLGPYHFGLDDGLVLVGGEQINVRVGAARLAVAGLGRRRRGALEKGPRF